MRYDIDSRNSYLRGHLTQATKESDDTMIAGNEYELQNDHISFRWLRPLRASRKAIVSIGSMRS